MYSAFILVGICVAVFLLQLLVSGFTKMFALVSADVLARPWTLVSAIFLHGGMVHLLYNMFALALFGMILESVIGRKKFLIVFFSAGILANVGSVFLYNAVLGASGAIFGILGMLAILRPRMQVWVSFMPMPMIFAAAVWAIGDFAGLFFPTGVGNLAHLIGLGFGLAGGFYFRKEYGEFRTRNPVNIDDKTMEEWEKKYMK